MVLELRPLRFPCYLASFYCNLVMELELSLLEVLISRIIKGN